MPTHQRLHGLDFLRASMMLLGIVLHGAQMYMTMHLGFDYYKDPQLSPIMDGLLIFINTFRMPVFFFLSGFFTALLYQRYAMGGMWSNRYRRIIVPFLVLLPPLAVVLTLQWTASSQLLATGSIGLDLSYIPYPRLLLNNTHHLWFLYYLFFILLGWSGMIMLWKLLPPGVARVMQRGCGHSLLSATAWILLLGLIAGSMALPNTFGRINGGIVFQPYWPAVALFGLCFAAGWGLWHRQDMLSSIERYTWTYLAFATACFAAALTAFFLQGPRDSASYQQLHPLLTLGNGLAMAFYIAGLTGLFSRYFSKYSPKIRYLSDSAYWVYILHQPALLLFAIPLYHWQAPAELKFALVCVATTVLCLTSYDALIRNGPIGTLLNGRRYPRGLPP